MADNTRLNQGSGGDLVRSEDVGGGVKVPVCKLHLGASGVDGGPVTITNRMPNEAILPQALDTGNTTAIVAPGTTFTGAWVATRSIGVVRLVCVLASTVASGLGCTFRFQFSEDGGATVTVDESRIITSFSTVRDFDLLNYGSHFRVIVTPDRAMVGAEKIFVNVQQSRSFDGPFVRLLSQALERQNLAIGHVGAFIRSFTPQGLSTDITSTQALQGSRSCLDVVVNVPGQQHYNRGRVATSAATEVPIRSTTYTEQAIGAQRSFASSSALDTAAGTGARTIRLTYYTLVAGAIAGPFTEDVTLLGLVRVNTVATDIALIESIEVITAGSGGVNAGVIELYTVPTVGGTIFASIAVGDRKTYYALTYVPSGSTFYLTSINCSSSSASNTVAAFSSRFLPYGGLVGAAERTLTDDLIANGSSGSLARTFNSPRIVTGPARVQFYVIPGSGTNQTQRLNFDSYITVP